MHLWLWPPAALQASQAAQGQRPGAHRNVTRPGSMRGGLLEHRAAHFNGGAIPYCPLPVQ